MKRAEAKLGSPAEAGLKQKARGCERGWGTEIGIRAQRRRLVGRRIGSRQRGASLSGEAINPVASKPDDIAGLREKLTGCPVQPDGPSQSQLVTQIIPNIFEAGCVSEIQGCPRIDLEGGEQIRDRPRTRLDSCQLRVRGSGAVVQNRPQRQFSRRLETELHPRDVV